MAAIQVSGMSCEHCRKSVLEAVEKVEGVYGAQVDLASGKVQWQGNADAATIEKVKAAITAIGFDVQ